MNKEKVIKLMIDHQTHLVKDLQEAVDFRHGAKDIDEGDTIDIEDLSHQSENSDMEFRLTAQLVKAEKYLDFISELNGDKHDAVQIGSLVETGKMNFLIGIPSIALKYKGKMIMGISTKAPIYQRMVGKKLNDKFSYGNKKYTIKNLS